VEKSNKKISGEVIKRLPRYYRYLGDLKKSGLTKISSTELSRRMNVTPSQIRQDLNCFGGFGQQGYGYNIENLYNSIGKILGLDSTVDTVIIGAGNLGSALANYKGFESRGFKLIGIFDTSSEKIGTIIADCEVLPLQDLEDFCKKNMPKIAMITVPKGAASEVAEYAAKCGIKGFLNFTYTDVTVPEGVAVENMHISDHLMMLSYKTQNM